MAAKHFQIKCLLAVVVIAGGWTLAGADNPSESAGQYDKWEDSDHSHTVEAKFLGFQSGCVRLERRDGKIKSVDFLRLSPESRRQALNRASVPERIAKLVLRMADARQEAIASLKAGVAKAQEDLAAVKHGTIDKRLDKRFMGGEQKIVNPNGTVRYKFSSADNKKSRHRPARANTESVSGRNRRADGGIRVTPTVARSKPGSHDPFSADTELKNAADAMHIGPMKAAIDGDPGQLRSAEVSEVWKDGEVVIDFRKSREAERVLLKGADTKMVADGFGFVSGRIWMVTGKTDILNSGRRRQIHSRSRASGLVALSRCRPIRCGVS